MITTQHCRLIQKKQTTGTGTVNLTCDLGNRFKNMSRTIAKTCGYDSPRPPRKLDRLATYSDETTPTMPTAIDPVSSVA